MLSFDFGITGDEEVQKIYGEKILSYFETDGEDKSALDYKNLYYYGGLFDYSAAWLNKNVGGFDTLEVYTGGFDLIAKYALGAGIIVLLASPLIKKLMGRVH